MIEEKANTIPMKYPESITGLQIRAARVLLEWTQQDLASEAGVWKEAVSCVECDNFGCERYIGPVLRALMAADIEFGSDRRTNKMGVVLQSNLRLADWRSTGNPS